MAKLKCSCGNSKKWMNIKTKNNMYEAECYECGTIVRGEGGIKVDTVVGQMTMEA